MHSHHESAEEQAVRRLFLEQATGGAVREYPAGRMGADDEGAIAIAMAVDPVHRTIVLRYAKPVHWVGLALNDAEQLRHMLSKKIEELKAMPKVVKKKCPMDTDGDGNCGRKFCPVCGND